MHIKILKFGLSAIIAVICATLLFQYTRTSSPALVYADVVSGTPIRIIIPRIHINATIKEVSKTQDQDGLIEPPKFALNVGWYKSGPKPGEEGSAVINGYVHWKYGYTAIFADLHFLKSGDIVSIKDDRGIVTSFIVREVKTYDLGDDVGEAFRSDDGRSHLNLITSDGIWDKLSKSYSKRLIVFTDKEMTTFTPETLVKLDNQDK